MVKRESASHQNKILPLSTENEALYKKLKEEEENSKHIPTEKNLVGSVSLSLPAWAGLHRSLERG